MRRLSFFSAICALSLCFSCSVWAATPKVGEPTPNIPAQIADRTTQVTVTHEGTDTIGIRLSTRLKELFNASNLFHLNEGDTAKMRILLTSKAEFADRPHVGSVYALLWVFSQSDAHLGYLLAQEVNVLSAEDIDAVAAKILERTDGISVKYAYLFKTN